MTNSCNVGQWLEKGTVENHLLARSHKTTTWSNTRPISPNVVVNKTSIVDGKRLAVYHPLREPSVKAVAIVPASARQGDLLIDLQGGRVPFTVSRKREDTLRRDQAETIGPSPQFCKLLGESAVNRVPADQSGGVEVTFVFL